MKKLKFEVVEAQGYEVLSALDGETALQLFNAHPAVELVLLDFAMPGMDGGVVAREMKMRWQRTYVHLWMYL